MFIDGIWTHDGYVEGGSVEDSSARQPEELIQVRMKGSEANTFVDPFILQDVTGTDLGYEMQCLILARMGGFENR